MSSKKQNLVSGIILILFGVAFIGVFIWYSNGHEAKLENCTEQVTAKVIEIIEDTEEELTNDYEYENTNMRYKTVEVYTPVFEYEYDGKNYRTRGRKSKYSAAFNVGDEVKLKINPSDPYDFYMMNGTSYKSISKIIMMLSGFFLIFGIYMLIKSNKKEY